MYVVYRNVHTNRGTKNATIKLLGGYVLVNKMRNSNFFIFILIISELLLALVTTRAFGGGPLTIGCFVALLLFLVIPCLLMRFRNIGAFFRFTILFFAFIPSLNPAIINGLFQNRNLFAIEITMDRCFTLLSVFSKELLPVMLILFAIYIKSGLKWKNWLIIFLISAILFGIGMLCLPGLSEICLYFMTYSLMIPTYYFLEKVYETCNENFKKIPMYLFIAVLFLRGIYQMLAILEVYPL